jgi:hypothetical protein
LEDARELIREAACFDHGVELAVTILNVTFLTYLDCTNYNDALRFVHAIDDAVICELMLPEIGKRAAKTEAVRDRINGNLAFRSFSQLISDAAVERLDVRGRGRSEANLKATECVRLSERRCRGL